MIQETIVTTINAEGKIHIAPMGVHIEGDQFIILPFRPSNTLNNLLETRSAVINCCDDVRIFVGCLTGRRDWSATPTEHIKGYYLTDCLAHNELILDTFEDHEVRPKLVCKAIHHANHRPFQGFNRAQFAVLEAAILISRLDRLPWDKIQTELNYLRIGLDKCAGDRELQAWAWLMEVIEQHRQKVGAA